MRCGLRILSMALALATAASVAIAQDAPKKGKKGDPGANAQVFQLPKDVTLTAEQQTKLDALKKEQGPKVAELQKKLDEILTDEQRQARKDAAAKSKEEKVKGKQAQERLAAALKLTDEQKPKWDAAQKEMQALQGKIREQLAGFLTDEQKAKVPALTRKKKNNA
jgi:predicted Holliday junction resolvase-like endonuclease